MSDDKIIRALSDIDEQYILEAAPGQGRRSGKRLLWVRIAGIAAAVLILGLAGVIGLRMLGPAGSGAKSAATNAAYDAEAPMEAAEEVIAGDTAAAQMEETKAETLTQAGAAAEPNDAEAADEVLVEEGEMRSEEAMTGASPASVAVELYRDGEAGWLLFVHTEDPSAVAVTENAEAFTELLRNENGILYKIDAENSSDIHGTITMTDGESREITITEALLQDESALSREFLDILKD